MTMKITVSVNLGGYSFNIDEDAYAELKRYLKNLELHFASEESASEILSDIETRISELFRPRLNAYKQVISIDDVRYAISVLGTPEDISDNETSSAKDKFSRPGYNRMYRDPDNRIIGGVCAGMGAYWHLEPWLVRIIFFVLAMMGGLGVLVYLVLYIKETVKKEFETVRRNMKL
jgi:phage shock protein PspC (stress-responsive transcriptional regulator)